MTTHEKRRVSANSSGKPPAPPQSVNGAIKGICDVMRRLNCAGAMQLVAGAD